ncbi:ankyrin repeat-containing domain protein, partial [Baffinella frigidus]
LFTAALLGLEEEVRQLHAEGANLEQGGGVKNSPPLFAAVWGNHLNVVLLLLQLGANIHATNNDGATPLHFAAFKGHTDLARLLLERGADLGDETITGMTPEDIATSKGRVETAAML